MFTINADRIVMLDSKVIVIVPTEGKDFYVCTHGSEYGLLHHEEMQDGEYFRSLCDLRKYAEEAVPELVGKDLMYIICCYSRAVWQHYPAGDWWDANAALAIISNHKVEVKGQRFAVEVNEV